MKIGQTFDLVEIMRDSFGYGVGLEMGQQCLSELNPTNTLINVHYTKFNYGHHPNPIVLYQRDLKKIGKLTITKVK